MSVSLLPSFSDNGAVRFMIFAIDGSLFPEDGYGPGVVDVRK